MRPDSHAHDRAVASSAVAPRAWLGLALGFATFGGSGPSVAASAVFIDVAARAGASHEVVEEGVNGLLYEPGDRASLVETVRRVVDDEDYRTKLAKNARAAAEKRNWKAATQVLRGYYEKALAAG